MTGNSIFDKYQGKYWNDYVNKTPYFYQKIGFLLKKNLRSRETVCDVGAGPGGLAYIADQLNIPINIIGIEPSKLHKDGQKLKNILIKKHSRINYIPVHSKFSDLADNNKILKPNQKIMGFIFMKSLHEIAKSLHSKEKLYNKIRYIIKHHLKKNGVLIIGEPQYNEDIMAQNNKWYNWTKKFLYQAYGHEDTKKQIITQKEWNDFMKSTGLKRKSSIILEHRGIKKAAKEAGYRGKKSPILYHFQVHQKQ